MRKVLCPICGNVIRFNENETSLTCDVCRSAIKIKIQSIEDKNLISEAESGLPSEQLFSDDEIIIAELDDKREAAPISDATGANRKDSAKKIPPAYGVKSKAQEEKSDFADVNLKADTANVSEKIENESCLTLDADAYLDSAAPQNALKAATLDADIKWINWADIECESELLFDNEITKPNEAAKSKKKLKVPLNYRLAYIPVYSFCTLISVLVLLYTPFLYIRGDNNVTIYGAKTIGALLNVANYSFENNIYLLISGALITAMILSSAGYLFYAFRNYGEYNSKILKTSYIFAMITTFFTVALLSMFLLAAKKEVSDVQSIKMAYSGVFIALPLQLYVLISNMDKLPKYRDSKKVLLSPKSTRRKAYLLLCVAMFFIWSLLFSTIISLGSNIAYNAIYNLTGGASSILPKLSALALGAFGSVFSFVWNDTVAVNSVTANYLIYSYVQYATLAVTVLLVIIYARYAGKTAGIFLDEIKPKGNENVLLENEIKELNLAKFLKKSSSLSFIVYAAAITLDLVGYVILYSGTANLLPALFTMLSFIIAALIRRYPFAVLAREQYMKAYVEYEEMGADIPPMTKRQRTKLELCAFIAAMLFTAVFAVTVFL